MRALSAVALAVFVLLPLQGSAQSASSATPASRLMAAKTPKVFLALKKKKVTTNQRAHVKVVVAPPKSRSAAAGVSPKKAFGRLKVVVKGGGQKRRVSAVMADHRTVVALPKLPKGVYRVHAKFLGNASLGKARSGSKTLFVVAGVGTSGPTGFPNETNTGVPAGTKLTAYTGPSTISKANTVIDGKTMGCIQVTAPGVVIRNSHISCRPSYAAVTVDDGDLTGGTPLLLQDVEIDCQNGSGNGVGEAMVTVQRANIHGCENGLDINQAITVEDSYIHDLWNPSAAHADGIQLAGGHLVGNSDAPAAANVTITHNTIYGVGYDNTLGTSAIISNPKGDTNILIQDNLLAGGAYTLYCDYQAKATNYRVIDNHFSRKFSQKVGDYGPSDGCSDETLSGNVYHETGAPIHLS
jgi:hypothetical protein